MKTSQFFALVATIYIAPHLSNGVGGLMAFVFFVLAGLMLLIKD